MQIRRILCDFRKLFQRHRGSYSTLHLQESAMEFVDKILVVTETIREGETFARSVRQLTGISTNRGSPATGSSRRIFWKCSCGGCLFVCVYVCVCVCLDSLIYIITAMLATLWDLKYFEYRCLNIKNIFQFLMLMVVQLHKNENNATKQTVNVYPKPFRCWGLLSNRITKAVFLWKQCY